MYSKTKLKNGLTLITAPLKETKAVTVLVLLPVGSRYEGRSINGASHFIEHLMFKGTKRRPTSLDISKALDSVGAEYNAFTSKDHTGYYVKVASEEIELAFDLLSDMLFNSTFAVQEINKERGVIIEEINMYQDNPLIYLGALFEKTIFGDNSLGWIISGPKEVIKKISRRAILNYKNKFYQPAKMILTVSGNFNKNKVRALAKEYFGNNTGHKNKNGFKKIKISQNKPKIELFFKATEQVQLGLGFPSYSLNDPKIYPLYLLAVILGGNMSSRLFTTVREKYGLAYYIKADFAAYQDVGALLVQAGLDKARINQAISLILAELKIIRDQGVTDKELESAKEFLKGKLVLELEDSENVADWYGKQELLLNKISTPEEKLKKVFAVKKGQIKKIAQELIQEQNLNLVLIGPFKQPGKFRKLLKL
ncbi:MAG: pitrilysin family protein [Patescibacteria group bacterium]|jgi:predicted Zn-dependent peptidase